MARVAIDAGQGAALRSPEVQDIGRVLILLGVVAIAAGAALLLAGRIPWLGRLPGDILIRRGPGTFYFPLATCLVVSIVLTIIVNLFWRR